MFASLGIDVPTGILLCLALLLALSFEFVNGFHDTANAVATVIYTNTLKPTTAVVWSGSWNLIGVLTSSGAVAFGIVALLPVELVINVGSGAGFAMVFSLLLSAIIWNIGTWYLGLPASSSHTLIGSIVGVGLDELISKSRQRLWRRRQLAQGCRYREGAVLLAHYRLCGRRAAAACSPRHCCAIPISSRRRRARHRRRAGSAASSCSPALE